MPVNDADGAVAELAASQHGAFTRRQAAERQMTTKMARRRLNAGVLTEPVAGVLVLASAPPTWRQRLTVATLAAPGPALVSGRAAAALHGLDGFSETGIELLVTRGRYPDLPGAVIHQACAIDPCDRYRIDGIPVTGLARTLADLGQLVAPDQVQRALDDARRRDVSLRWLRQTAERLHRPGQRGTGVLMRLLEEAAADPKVPDSWFERLVEACLLSPNLRPLERQFEVRDSDGGFVARVDVGFPTIRLAVEAHSRRFHDGDVPEAADEDRDHRLAQEGWEVLYVRWQSVRRPADVLDVVERTAAHRRALHQVSK